MFLKFECTKITVQGIIVIFWGKQRSSSFLVFSHFLSLQNVGMQFKNNGTVFVRKLSCIFIRDWQSFVQLYELEGL